MCFQSQICAKIRETSFLVAVKTGVPGAWRHAWTKLRAILRTSYCVRPIWSHKFPLKSNLQWNQVIAIRSPNLCTFTAQMSKWRNSTSYSQYAGAFEADLNSTYRLTNMKTLDLELHADLEEVDFVRGPKSHTLARLRPLLQVLDMWRLPYVALAFDVANAPYFVHVRNSM